MGGENTAAGVAIKLHQPGEGMEHGVLRITGALEQLDGVAVGGQFHGSGIVTGDNSSSDRRDGTATGKYFFQQSCTQADPHAEHLRFGGMTEVFMGYFMGQDAAQLLVAGLP